MEELTQGQKRHASMVKKYGSEEAYKAKQKEWSSKGGKNSPSRIDLQTPERRREIQLLGREAFAKALGKPLKSRS